MRGGLYNGIKDVTLGTFTKPEIRPGTLRVRNVRAGICGTDVNVYLHGGDNVGIYPGNQFGHEFFGEIDEIGEGVEGFEVGQRVYVNPLTFRDPPEGLGITASADMAGAFSEYVLIEKPEHEVSLFVLPDELEDNKAAFIEPFSVAIHGVNIADPKPGMKAIIFGAGTIGLSILVELLALGVKDVIVSDMLPNRLETVRKLGGIPCDASKKNVNDVAIETWGAGQDWNNDPTTLADFVFDASGHKGSIRDFVEGGKVGSTYISYAMGMAKDEISTTEITVNSFKLIGSAGYTPENNRQVIDLLSREDVDVKPLTSAVYGLSDITEAFAFAADKEKAIKVLIDHSK